MINIDPQAMFDVSGLTCYIVYNKWHETELERWLSDHNVPYPTPADRKDLENLVKKNWESKISSPYSDWEPAQLQSYLKVKGHDFKQGAESNKDSLVAQVKSYWTESSDAASNSYKSVKDWIFDRYLLGFVEAHPAADVPLFQLERFPA